MARAMVSANLTESKSASGASDVPPGAKPTRRTSSLLKSVGFTTTRTPFASVHSVTPISGMVRVVTTRPGAGAAAMRGTV